MFKEKSMNISKFNPIGYEAKTAKGNTYKKSNLWKTTSLATCAVVDTALTFSKSKLIQENNTVNIANKLGIKNPKLVSLFTAGSLLLEVLTYYLLGAFLDKKVNKQRAEKADLNA